jgi:hypothetical protein
MRQVVKEHVTPAASLAPAPLLGAGIPLGLWRELHPAVALQLQLPFAATTRATDETIGPVRDSEAAEPGRLPQLGSISSAASILS